MYVHFTNPKTLTACFHPRGRGLHIATFLFLFNISILRLCLGFTDASRHTMFIIQLSSLFGLSIKNSFHLSYRSSTYAHFITPNIITVSFHPLCTEPHISGLPFMLITSTILLCFGFSFASCHTLFIRHSAPDKNPPSYPRCAPYCSTFHNLCRCSLSCNRQSLFRIPPVS